MTNDTNFNKNVIASVVASVIVIIFINPLINLTWKSVSWFSTYCYKGLNDAIYSNAALGQRDWVAVLVFNSNMCILLGIFTGFTLMFLFRRDKIRKIADNSAFQLWFKIGYALLYVLTVVSTLVMLSFVRADLQLNASFQQRLAVLAPAVSDIELRQLRASWALMKSRQDYEAIIAKMDGTAKTHGIVLPKLLIK